MEFGWDILIWWLIIVGHLGLWCGLFNRTHATAWSRACRKFSEKIIFLIILLPMVWVLTVLIGSRTTSLDAIFHASRVAYGYGVGCIILSIFFIPRWCYRKSVYRLPDAVIEKTTKSLKVIANPDNSSGTSLLHGKRTRLLGALPFNQILRLDVDRTTFEIAQLPDSLIGLKICQLSDLHFTGKIGREFFEEVVRQANRFAPDLIFITGDIIDKLECIDWIESVLGKLTARLGKFYVLGNHDLRIADQEMLRSRLADQGFVAACGQWHTIQIGDSKIQLTGNETPWYTGANKLSCLPPVTTDQQVFRILLSHSPDQFKWALDYDIDLMFAGHTHGGQIRLPLIGPVVAPSKYGVKYCSGTFDFDGMIMHVSRGLSGDDPIRINCPPELGLFTLTQKM